MFNNVLLYIIHTTSGVCHEHSSLTILYRGCIVEILGILVQRKTVRHSWYTLYNRDGDSGLCGGWRVLSRFRIPRVHSRIIFLPPPFLPLCLTLPIVPFYIIILWNSFFFILRFILIYFIVYIIHININMDYRVSNESIRVPPVYGGCRFTTCWTRHNILLLYELWPLPVKFIYNLLSISIIFI